LDKDRSCVFAPATVANVGCGFDIFGLALHRPGDKVRLKVTDRPGVSIVSITGDAGILPKDAELNTAGKSVLTMLQHLNADFGIELELNKEMPVGSGLGSSAASSVASVFALNQILKQPLAIRELLNFALEGERIASGDSVHLDNIGACLYGGFVLIRSKEPPDIVSVPVPHDLHFTVVHPRIEVKTSESRRMIRPTLSLPLAITQWGNVAGVITALFESDYELLKRSMTDVVIEPVRSMLIPHYKILKECAMENGAYGFGISGSGPSVFAVTRSAEDGEKIGKNLGAILAERKVDYDLYVSAVNREGPKVIE
jgi:homoserine kinase